MIYYEQISRAATLRPWEASDGSLRNFTGKTQKKGNCPQSSFASFDVSFRALSGASSDALEEVSVFRPRRCLEMGASSQEDKVEQWITAKGKGKQ